MNEKSPLNNEDIVLKQALGTIEVPSDRLAMRKRFLASLQEEVQPKPVMSWQRLLAPRLLVPAAATYALAAVIYVMITISSAPLKTVMDGQTRLSLMHQFRLGQGGLIQMEKDDVLRLSDGSEVTCLKPAKIAAQYSRKERRIDLQDGVIEVAAAHNRSQPMRVWVRDTQVEVTGTRFIVSAEVEGESR